MTRIFFLKVKNEFSGVELSCILSISVLKAILRLVGVHCPVPTHSLWPIGPNRLWAIGPNSKNMPKNKKRTHLNFFDGLFTKTVNDGSYFNLSDRRTFESRK